VHSILLATRYLIELGGMPAEEALVKSQTSSMVRLINSVATKYALTITEKELVLLIPAANAVLNGGVNIAFLSDCHRNVMDHFRSHCLSEKYGEKEVDTAIAAEIVRIKTRSKAA